MINSIGICQSPSTGNHECYVVKIRTVVLFLMTVSSQNNEMFSNNIAFLIITRYFLVVTRCFSYNMMFSCNNRMFFCNNRMLVEMVFFFFFSVTVMYFCR